MAQGKFTTSPTPQALTNMVNGLVDDIAGKAASSHTHNYAASSHNHSAANITSGTLAVARGGTGVTANPSMLTNLGSTTAASVFAASPRPGVTGTLPIANGGTGATTTANAVKALLGTTAIGSSTKPMYYDGATLKACADSIGGGGIVAQSLGENGYVKFANGLILQWGYKASLADEKTYFPITFTQILGLIAFVLNEKLPTNTAHAAAKNIDVDGFVFYVTQSGMLPRPDSSADGFYFCLGIA